MEKSCLLKSSEVAALCVQVLKKQNVVKSSFLVLFVRRFIKRTQKVYVFHSLFIFIGEYGWAGIWLGWVRIKRFRKPVFNVIDGRQGGIARGIHIKIRLQLGNMHTFFVSMKVRKDYLSAPPVREKYNIGMYMLVPVY